MKPRNEIGTPVDSDWTRWGRKEWVSVCVGRTSTGRTRWSSVGGTRYSYRGSRRGGRRRLPGRESTSGRIRLERKSRCCRVQLLCLGSGRRLGLSSCSGSRSCVAGTRRSRFVECDILPGGRSDRHSGRLSFWREWRNGLDLHRRFLRSFGLYGRSDILWRFEGIGLGFND